MYWNHRVIKRVFPNDEAEYGIYEVFYEDDVPDACTLEPVEVAGESVEALRQTLVWMLVALDDEVLDYSSIGGE